MESREEKEAQVMGREQAPAAPQKSRLRHTLPGGRIACAHCVYFSLLHFQCRLYVLRSPLCLNGPGKGPFPSLPGLSLLSLGFEEELSSPFVQNSWQETEMGLLNPNPSSSQASPFTAAFYQILVTRIFISDLLPRPASQLLESLWGLCVGDNSFFSLQV